MRKSGPLRFLDGSLPDQSTRVDSDFEHDNCHQKDMSTYLTRVLHLLLWKSQSETEDHMKNVDVSSITTILTHNLDEYNERTSHDSRRWRNLCIG